MIQKRRKKAREKIEKNISFLGNIFSLRNIAIASLVGILGLGTAHYFRSSRNNPKQEHLLQEEKIQKSYKDWMKHYNPEGISLQELEKSSPTMQKLILEKEANPDKIQELVGGPMVSFSKTNRNYEDYKPEHLLILYTNIQEMKVIKEFCKKRGTEFKGLEQIVKYVKQNKEDLLNLDDQNFSLWALNAGFYVARKSFRGSEVQVNTEEEMEKALKDGYGDCAINSFITSKIYRTLLKRFNKRHLSKRLSFIHHGFKLRFPGLINHIYLEFDHKGKKTVIETNFGSSDYIFNEDYNSQKIYIEGILPQEAYYIPLAKTDYIPNDIGSFTPVRKILILPSKLEKEINTKSL